MNLLISTWGHGVEEGPPTHVGYVFMLTYTPHGLEDLLPPHVDISMNSSMKTTFPKPRYIHMG